MRGYACLTLQALEALQERGVMLVCGILAFRQKIKETDDKTNSHIEHKHNPMSRLILNDATLHNITATVFTHCCVFLMNLCYYSIVIGSI